MADKVFTRSSKKRGIDVLETVTGKRVLKIIKEYEDFLSKALAKGDLRKTPTFKQWVNSQYGGTTYATIENVVNKSSPKLDLPQLPHAKDILLGREVAEANKGDKYISMRQIFKKSKTGFIKSGPLAAKYIPLLETEADKIRKVFDKIVATDEIIKWPSNYPKKGSRGGKSNIKNPLYGMIHSRTGAGSGSQYITQVLEQGKTSRGEPIKMGLYKPKHTFPKDLLRLAGHTGVIHYEKPFSEIVAEAKYRQGGGLIWSQQSIRPDTATTINDFALRHWDLHSKRKTPSQIEFFWRKNNKPVEYDKVPKDKWGMKKGLKTTEVFFKYKKDPLQREWDLAKLRKDGRASNLFPEVYAAKNEYNRLLTKKVPDPKTGKLVTFEDLMRRTYQKGFGFSPNSPIYGLDHEKLIAEKPFNALRVASQRLNNQLSYISRFAKQKNFKKILMNSLDLREFDDPLKAGQKLAEKVLVEGYRAPLDPVTGKMRTGTQELAQTVLKKDLSKLTTPMVDQLVNLFSRSGKQEVVRPILEAAALDAGNICKIVFGKGVRYGRQAGGLHGGCAVQMADALNNEPVAPLNKLKNLDVKSGPLLKVKNAAQGFLAALGRFGPKVGKYGAIAAAGALAQPLVKQFMNDDPSTYLTDPDQQAGMLDALIETQERTKPRSEILDWTHTGATVGATAAAVPGTSALYKARRLPTLRREAMGPLRAGTIGPAMKLVSGMFTPAGLLATEPLRIAQKRREGESWGEIGTDPTMWMGPAFAPGMTRMATRGMNPASLLPKLLRLGMSRAALAAMGPIGWAGLAASLGWEGYSQYQDYKKGRGFFASDEE